MKCKSCGAENLSSMTVCGNCGAPLSHQSRYDSEQSRKQQDVRQTEVRTVTGSNASNVSRRRQPAVVPTMQILAVAVLTLIVSLASLVPALASGDEIPVMSLLMLLSSLAVFMAIPLTKRQSARMAEYMCARGDMGVPLVSSRATQRGLIIALPVLASAFLVGSLILVDDMVSFFVAIGIAVLIFGTMSAAILMSRVFIVGDGICIGAPSAPMMLRLSFEKIRRVTLSGRMLKVTMTEKMSAFAPMDFRYIILGDTRSLAATLQAYALTRGADIAVENVDIDPNMLNASLKALPRPSEAVRADGGAADIGIPQPEPSWQPRIAAALLHVAGGMAIITGFALLAFDNAFADQEGYHLSFLGCCWAVEFLLGALAIVGGYFCSRRKRYRYVLVSALAAIVSFGAFVSTILGIVALVLVIKSEDEFED